MTFKEKMKTDKALRGLVEAMENRFNVDHTRMVEFGALCYQYGEQEQRMANLEAGLLSSTDDEPTQSS